MNKVTESLNENVFDVGIEYEKDRYPQHENKIMWRGIALLTAFAVLDWELFQWMFEKLTVKH